EAARKASEMPDEGTESGLEREAEKAPNAGIKEMVREAIRPLKPAARERPSFGRTMGSPGTGFRGGSRFGPMRETREFIRPRETSGFYKEANEAASQGMMAGFERQERRPVAAAPEISVVKPAGMDEAKPFGQMLEELKGTMKAKLLSADFSIIAEVPVRELLVAMKNNTGTNAVVFDGIITQKVVDTAKEQGVKFVVGIKKGKIREEKEVKSIALEP
ncbi:MAG: hypothetical protein WC602_02485, partial [archaeon]